MAASTVIPVIQNYLRVVAENGIPVESAVLYGSYARGEETADSDIDLIVISPLFDRIKKQADISKLWRLRVDTDARIEPIAAGVREWAEEQGSPILSIAREEGIVIRPSRRRR
jgi:predicted nucleotidyltransferase